MKVRFTKGHSSVDLVAFKRSDGTDVTLEVPKEPGCMPRAMARSVVERILGKCNSAVDIYLDPEKYESGASSDPTWRTTELLLKVLQDELSNKGQVAAADIAFQLRNVSQLLLLPRPSLNRQEIDLIAGEISRLYHRWERLPAGQSIILNTSVPLGENALEEIEPFQTGESAPNNNDNNDRDN